MTEHARELWHRVSRLGFTEINLEGQVGNETLCGRSATAKHPDNPICSFLAAH